MPTFLNIAWLLAILGSKTASTDRGFSKFGQEAVLKEKERVNRTFLQEER